MFLICKQILFGPEWGGNSLLIGHLQTELSTKPPNKLMRNGISVTARKLPQQTQMHLKGIIATIVVSCFRFLLASCAVLLGGCAAIDASLSDRVLNLNASLDRSSNDTILANIIRASYYQPLSFVGVSKVNGSQSVSLVNGLPTITFGPHQTVTQHQFIFGSHSLNNQASGNFDVAPLATKDFAKGVSVDISLAELSVLLKQGIPRDLLYSLAVDSIEFTDKGGVRRAFKNEPSDPTYEEFRAAILVLIAWGFSIETRLDENPAFDSNDKTSAKFMTKGRFCFDQANADFELTKLVRMGARWKCNDVWSRMRPQKPSNEDVAIDIYFPGEVKTVVNVIFRMRSIYGVFNCLGRLIAEGHLHEARAATDNDAKRIARALYNPRAGQPAAKEVGLPLLNITGAQLGPCFSSVSVNNVYHCVPQDGSENTKRIFSVLSQLLALKTSAVDLPNTPTVRVAP